MRRHFETWGEVADSELGEWRKYLHPETFLPPSIFEPGIDVSARVGCEHVFERLDRSNANWCSRCGERAKEMR